MGVPVFYQGSKYAPRPLVAIPPTPHFSAAEVGNVNASTVAVTFDTSVDAAGNDYSAGVTIKVNASVRAFESGIRQANHAVVYYALSTPIVDGDTVTWEYSAVAGYIVSEADSTLLADVSPQAVTNNIVDIGAVLRADAAAYWTLNETGVNATRSDSTEHGWGLVTYLDVPGVSGKFGNAAKFLDDPSNASDLDLGTFTVDISNGFTVSGWVWIPQLIPADDGNFYLFRATATGDTIQISCGIMVEGELPVEIYTEGLSVAVSIENWHQFIYYNDGLTGYLEVDHVIVGNSPAAKGVQTTAINYIGAANFKNSTDYILIDELGFWARPLTSDERDYLWNSGAGRALFPAP